MFLFFLSSVLLVRFSSSYYHYPPPLTSIISFPLRLIFLLFLFLPPFLFPRDSFFCYSLISFLSIRLVFFPLLFPQFCLLLLFIIIPLPSSFFRFPQHLLCFHFFYYFLSLLLSALSLSLFNFFSLFFFFLSFLKITIFFLLLFAFFPIVYSHFPSLLSYLSTLFPFVLPPRLFYLILISYFFHYPLLSPSYFLSTSFSPSLFFISSAPLFSILPFHHLPVIIIIFLSLLPSSSCYYPPLLSLHFRFSPPHLSSSSVPSLSFLFLFYLSYLIAIPYSYHSPSYYILFLPPLSSLSFSFSFLFFVLFLSSSVSFALFVFLLLFVLSLFPTPCFLK